MSRPFHTATWLALIGSKHWGGNNAQAKQAVEAIKSNDASWPIDPTESDENNATLVHVLFDNWPIDYNADNVLAPLVWALHSRGVDFSLKDKSGQTAIDAGRELTVQNSSRAWFQTRTALHAIEHAWQKNPRREEIAHLLGIGNQKVLAEIPSTKEQWKEKIDGIELGQWVFLHMFDGMQWGMTMRAAETSYPSSEKIEEDRQKDFNALLSAWKKAKYQNPEALMLARWAWQALEPAKVRSQYGQTKKSAEAADASRNRGKALIEGLCGVPMDTAPGGDIPYPEGHPWHEMAHTLRYAALARSKTLSVPEWGQLLESQQKSSQATKFNQKGTGFLITHPFKTLNQEVVDTYIPINQSGVQSLLGFRLSIHSDNDLYKNMAAWINDNCLSWMKRNAITPDPIWWEQHKARQATGYFRDKNQDKAFIETVDLLIATPQSNFTYKRPRI